MTRLTISAMIAIAAMTSLAHAQKREEPPVKVYVLVGQSNMLGYGTVEGDKPNTLRDIVKKEPKKYQFLINADGSWKERSDVWVHLGGSPGKPDRYSGLTPNYGGYSGLIGPEFGFGHMMGDVYKQPVLLIKATWGGKSLGNDFLPPSIGEYPKPTRPGRPGFYYYQVVRLVKEVMENINSFFPDYQGQGMEIAGLCYHQGWNDLGDLSHKYEKNLAAFINDIRSAKYGLGVPNLPVVIATSGMIEDKEHLIKQSQLAMGDKTKYPQFAGNVAVVNTDKPYGPEKLQFRFDPRDSPSDQGFHWNRNARTHLNIGTAMATEMLKLKNPTLPSRLMTFGVDQGVQLNWQLGSEVPKSVKLLRNGKPMAVNLPASQTAFTDTTALPGKNSYELVLEMPTSPTQKLTGICDTSIPELRTFRSLEGVTLQWDPRGKFDGFKISRDGKDIAASLSGEARSYEDKQAPEKGLVKYSILPTTGNSTPATTVVNRGPLDPGDALLYEPFDYPSDLEQPTTLFGKKGAVGAKGEYFTLQEKGDDKWRPMVAPGSLRYGSLPVTGNRAQTSARSFNKRCAIQLDGSLAKAGLLKDGATMWISYVSLMPASGGGQNTVTLESDDQKDGIGFLHKERQFETIVVLDGEVARRRIGPAWKGRIVLMVGKFVWGKDGKNDNFYPMWPEQDLKQPTENLKGKYRFLREPEAFNIDQTRLTRLVLQQGGRNCLDEIRVGPTYESVVGGGTKAKARGPKESK